MKTYILLGLLVVLSTALFSEELTDKYSIEVIEEGQAGTEPSKGDSVEMHYKG